MHACKQLYSVLCVCNCSVQPNAVRTQIRKHEQIRLKSKEKENTSRHTLVCSHWNPYKLEISGQLLTCDLKSNKISFGFGLFILIYMEFFFIFLNSVWASNVVIFGIFGFMWSQEFQGGEKKKSKLDHTKDDSLSKNPLLEGLLLRADRQCTAHELMIRQNWARCVRRA